jgi:predicted flap endonuclease-1-like 5' DNA nuclease
VRCRPHLPVYLILIVLALLAAAAIGYAIGRQRERGLAEPAPQDAAIAPPAQPIAIVAPSSSPTAPDVAAAAAPRPTTPSDDRATAERARLIRSLESEAAGLRRAIAGRDAELGQLATFARDRERLFGTLADARGDTARYRQLVIDLENNAPPPLLGGPGAPDDLKLIVGVGPMLERMLYQLGITTYRQIARWTERDIDDFDARLPEFPGRIRRDAWVTQARALHQSKYGEPVPPRDRA